MRKIIWDSMLDADLNVRYWTHLSRRYYTLDKYSKIFLAAMSSGTVASWGFWSGIPMLWKILSAGSALLAIALPLLNWPKMISNMGSLKEKWTEIRSGYEMVWIALEKGKNEAEIDKEFKKIKDKDVKASQEETNLPCNKK